MISGLISRILMANKYTYSRTIETSFGMETFKFEGGASFDESKREVEKGIRDRLLEIKKEASSTPGGRQ